MRRIEDNLAAIFICSVIFNAFIPIIEFLALDSGVPAANALVIIIRILLEPSPITYFIWIVLLMLYFFKRFFDFNIPKL